MSERTSRQAISQVAQALFDKGAAERVIVAAMPKLRAAMHLDTVFTFADRDCVLLYPDIVDGIKAFSYRPDGKGGVELHKDKGSFVETMRHALGLKKMRVVETGGNDYVRERTQWERRQPGLRCAQRGLCLRPQHLHEHAVAQGRHRGDHHLRRRTRARSRRRSLHDLSNPARRR
jgi:arginine deiminase